jgi:hypothetical protein
MTVVACMNMLGLLAQRSRSHGMQAVKPTRLLRERAGG